MMEIQCQEIDESWSVLVWDQDLPVPFGSVPVPFLNALGTGVVPFGTRGIQIWTGSIMVSCQKWGNGIKEGTEECDCGSHPR